MQNHPIRQHFQRLRSSLSSSKQEQNAFLASQNINRFIGYRRPKKIGAYLSTRGELSLNPWIARSVRQQVYLPMLYETVSPQLRFAPYNYDTKWKKNRFNITEPDTHWGGTLPAQRLDIILLPLVAFDRDGNRLGMGGGYYDRSLAFRSHRLKWLKPLLVGIAHSCQEYPGLDSNSWDVSMDWIITEKEIIRVNNVYTEGYLRNS